MGNLIDHLRRAVLAGGEADLTDGQLLECFISSRDEAAVAALVRRHGPMVWGVCCRVLHNHHDVEDAFQATFLVLVRKAASILPREMVGNWLYGVARQTALKARATTAKRQVREKQVTEMPEPQAVSEPDLWHDLEPLLDQELSRLPDKYRAVIVLCDLGGKTRREAARQLKIPEGTISSRLTSARTMLAKRLAQHGLAISGGMLATVLSAKASPASVPTSVLSSTIKAANLFASGQAAATGAISVNVAALTEGVLKSMLLTKLKTASVMLLVVFVIGSGLLTVSIAGSKSAVADDRKPEASGADTPKRGDVASVPATANAVGFIFNSNDALGDEKFTGKRLQVAGRRERIRRFGDKYVLTMKAGELLWFEFDAKDRKQLAALDDQILQVTIQGQCDGRTTVHMGDKAAQVIRFRNCEIVEAAKRERGQKGVQGEAKKP